jgi:hypothetical protein
MLKTLSDQLRPDGITAKVIHPASTQTEGVWQRLDNQSAEEGTSFS